MANAYAWLVAVGAGLACLMFFFLVTRRIGSHLLRIIMRCLAAVWLLLPAMVPGYPGTYAPAFVVLIFEGLLQKDGDPALAAHTLLWPSLSVLVLVGIWYALFGRSRHQAKPGAPSDSVRTAAPVPRRAPQSAGPAAAAVPVRPGSRRDTRQEPGL